MLPRVLLGGGAWRRTRGRGRHFADPLRNCLEGSGRGAAAAPAGNGREKFEGVRRRPRIKETQAGGEEAEGDPDRGHGGAGVRPEEGRGGRWGLGPKGANPLGSFFPFDPYLLSESHVYVAGNYWEWTGRQDLCGGASCHGESGFEIRQ